LSPEPDTFRGQNIERTIKRAMFGTYCRDLRDGKVYNCHSHIPNYQEVVQIATQSAFGLSTRDNPPLPMRRVVGDFLISHGFYIYHDEHDFTRAAYNPNNPLSRPHIDNAIKHHDFREDPIFRYEVRITGNLILENETPQSSLRCFVVPWNGFEEVGVDDARLISWLDSYNMSEFVSHEPLMDDTVGHVKVWDNTTKIILEYYNNIPADSIVDVAGYLFNKYRSHYPEYDSLACVSENCAIGFRLGRNAADPFDSTHQKVHIEITSSLCEQKSQYWYKVQR
jgi:hypothetical protein